MEGNASKRSSAHLKASTLENPKKKKRRPDVPPAGPDVPSDSINSGAIEGPLPVKQVIGKGKGENVTSYPYIATPTFWGKCPKLERHELYPTLMQLVLDPSFEDTMRESRVMALLTSRPLPIFQSRTEVDVDVSQTIGQEGTTIYTYFRLVKGSKMRLKKGMLDDAMKSTETFMRAQLKKDVRVDNANNRLLIVPIKRDYEMTLLTSEVKVKRGHIAWDDVSAVRGPICTRFDMDRLPEQVVDALATTDREFGSRFYVHSILTGGSSSSHPDEPWQKDGTTRQASSAPAKFNQPMLACFPVTPSGVYVSSVGRSNPDERLLDPTFVLRYCIPASVFGTTSMLPFSSASSTIFSSRKSSMRRSSLASLNRNSSDWPCRVHYRIIV